MQKHYYILLVIFFQIARLRIELSDRSMSSNIVILNLIQYSLCCRFSSNCLYKISTFLYLVNGLLCARNYTYFSQTHPAGRQQVQSLNLSPNHVHFRLYHSRSALMWTHVCDVDTRSLMHVYIHKIVTSFIPLQCVNCRFFCIYSVKSTLAYFVCEL